MAWASSEYATTLPRPPPELDQAADVLMSQAHWTFSQTLADVPPEEWGGESI